MNKSEERYTCIGKGGTYELLGIVTPKDYVSTSCTYLGQSIGAGLSKMENFKIHQDQKGDLVYEKDIAVYGINHGPRHVYKDVETGQLFHRTKDDFENRLEIIK